jgi:hypothetical protein
MARGDSGRIVIEVNPELKRQLYSALAVESQTLKDWFIQAADRYVNDQKKPDASKGKTTQPPTGKKP